MTELALDIDADTFVSERPVDSRGRVKPFDYIEEGFEYDIEEEEVDSNGYLSPEEYFKSLHA